MSELSRVMLRIHAPDQQALEAQLILEGKSAEEVAALPHLYFRDRLMDKLIVGMYFIFAFVLLSLPVKVRVELLYFSCNLLCPQAIIYQPCQA